MIDKHGGVVGEGGGGRSQPRCQCGGGRQPGQKWPVWSLRVALVRLQTFLELEDKTVVVFAHYF